MQNNDFEQMESGVNINLEKYYKLIHILVQPSIEKHVGYEIYEPSDKNLNKKSIIIRTNQFGYDDIIIYKQRKKTKQDTNDFPKTISKMCKMEREIIRERFNEIQKLQVDLSEGEEYFGLAGTTYKINYYYDNQNISLEWRGDGPKLWQPFTTKIRELIDIIEMQEYSEIDNLQENG